MYLMLSNIHWWLVTATCVVDRLFLPPALVVRWEDGFTDVFSQVSTRTGGTAQPTPPPDRTGDTPCPHPTLPHPRTGQGVPYPLPADKLRRRRYTSCGYARIFSCLPFVLESGLRIHVNLPVATYVV